MDDDSELPLTSHDIHLRGEMVAQGWTDRQLQRAVAGGQLAKVRRGAYVAADLVAGLSPRDQHRVRARAVLRRAADDSVLSHQSAAAEWGVPLWRLDLSEVSVTRLSGNSGRREAGIVHHAGRLPFDQISFRNGVPLTAAARTALEILTTSDLEMSFCFLNAVLHAGRTTLDEVRRVFEFGEHWPNTLNVHIALPLASPLLGSVGESRFRLLCRRQRLPLPQLQVEVHDDDGFLLGIVDSLWPEAGVFVEFDGRLKYEQHRGPGESVAEYVLREKLREERICAATGWVCIRIGWADLARPGPTAARIRRLLASRRGTAAS